MNKRILWPALALAAIAGLLLPLGWWAGEALAKRADSELRERLVGQALDVAGDLSPALVKRLSFTKADINNPSFEELQSEMTAIARSLSLRGIRSIAIREGHLVYGPQTYLESDSMADWPGTEYRGAPEEFRRIFENRRSVAFGPYSAPQGRMVSALAPVFDPRNGELLMALSVDISAADRRAVLDDARRFPMLSALALALLLVVGNGAVLLGKRRMKFDDFRLKAWILVPVAAAMLAGIAVTLVFEYRSLDEGFRRGMLSTAEQIQNGWDQTYAAQVALLETKMDSIAENKAFQEAFLARDFSGLEVLARPVLDRLRPEYHIVHLLFAEPDRRVFLRAESPDRRGDIVGRSTMLAAQRSGGDVWGMDVGGLGDLSLRYVRPWKRDGRLIGYLELGVPIERLVDKAFAAMNADVFTVMRKKNLSREQFEAGRRIYGFSGRWDAYAGFVVVHQSNPVLPAEVQRRLEQDHESYGGYEAFYARQGSKLFAAEVVNLNDLEGHDIAHLVVMRDITTAFEAVRSSVLMVAGVVIAILGGILIPLWLVLGSTERGIASLFADLREKEERYRAVADHTFAWESWFAPDGSLIYCSPSCEALTGYSVAEFFEDPELLTKIAHPHERDHLAEHFDGLSADGDESLHEIDARITTKSGEERWISHVCQRIHAKDGTYLGRRSSNYDITERHRDEAMLRMLVQAINQSPVTTVVTDAEGDIEFVNPKFTETTGYAAEEVIGKNPRILNAGDRPSSEYKDMWETILSGRDWRGVFHNKRKNGERYWESAILSPVMDETGNVTHIMALKEDITERKKMEERLRLQAQAMDSASGYILIVDAAAPELPVIYANAAFERVTGYAIEEAVGRNCRFLQGSDREQPGLAEIRRGLAEGRACQAMLRNYRKDGTMYWNDIHIAPVRDENGALSHYIGISNDVTELVRAQEKLRENEERIRIAQEYANIGTWDLNIKTGELFWSERIGPLFGYPLGDRETTYENFLEAVHPEDRQLVSDAVRNCLEKGEVYQIEHRCLWPDGTVRWLLENGNISRDETGAPSHMLGLVQDITRRKDAEIRLRETEERLSLAVEGAGDGIWDWDLKTDEMLFSRQYMEMLGYAEGELPPRVETWRNGVHPDDQPRVRARLNDYLEGSAPDYVVELRMLCRDGSFKWVLCRGAVVARDKEGRPLRMIGIHSDIAKRKEDEAALVESREIAERANRAKSEFLSSMSHELRTPMNAILGFGQLLEMDESLPPSQRDSIQEITKAGRHLLDLINEVLDLSRIETGRIDLSIEPVACAALADECLKLVAPLAVVRGIRLNRGPLPDLTVLADRMRLKQVLVNLLSNAVKYNRPQGEVEMEVSAVEGRARFTVADTGPGISEGRMGELFTPFNRLGAENSEIEGTGIGLTISKRLVELMGGLIGVESRPGEGSRFWADIPLVETKGEEPKVETSVLAAEDSAAAGFEHVLLYIEDNPSNLRLMARILKLREHIDLMTAQSSSFGLELAAIHHPDLILLDLNMPEMDGYEVLSLLRASDWGRDIPVIAVTAHAMPDDIERGRAAGFADYLTKPLDIPRFLAAVDAQLAKNVAR